MVSEQNEEKQLILKHFELRIQTQMHILGLAHYFDSCRQWNT